MIVPTECYHNSAHADATIVLCLNRRRRSYKLVRVPGPATQSWRKIADVVSSITAATPPQCRIRGVRIFAKYSEPFAVRCSPSKNNGVPSGVARGHSIFGQIKGVRGM